MFRETGAGWTSAMNSAPAPLFGAGLSTVHSTANYSQGHASSSKSGDKWCRRAIRQDPRNCSYIRKHCAGYGKGAVDYVELYYCTYTSWKPALFLMIAAWLSMLFIWLGVSASEYFSPNISTLAELLHLPESLAGVTLLAVGNGAPDLFSTFSAVRAGSGALAIGQLVGSASFIVSIVVGATTLVVPAYKVNQMSYLRELCFFVIAVGMVAVIVLSERLSQVLALCMVGLYAAYVATVMVTTYYEQRTQRYTGLDTQAYSEHSAVGSAAEGARLGHSPAASPIIGASQEVVEYDRMAQDLDSQAPSGARRTSADTFNSGHADESPLLPRLDVDGSPEHAFGEFLLHHRRSLLTAVEFTDFLSDAHESQADLRTRAINSQVSLPLHSYYNNGLSMAYDDEQSPLTIRRHASASGPTPTPPWLDYTMEQPSATQQAQPSWRMPGESPRPGPLAPAPVGPAPSGQQSLEDDAVAEQLLHSLPETNRARLTTSRSTPASLSQWSETPSVAPHSSHHPLLPRRNLSAAAKQTGTCAAGSVSIPEIHVHPPTPLLLQTALVSAGSIDGLLASPRSARSRPASLWSAGKISSPVSERSTRPQYQDQPQDAAGSIHTLSFAGAQSARKAKAIALLRLSIPTLRHWRSNASVLRKAFIAFSALPVLMLTLTVPVLAHAPRRQQNRRPPAHSERAVSSDLNCACTSVVRRCSNGSNHGAGEGYGSVAEGPADSQARAAVRGSGGIDTAANTSATGRYSPYGLSPAQSFADSSRFSFETSASFNPLVAPIDPAIMSWADGALTYVRSAVSPAFLYSALCWAISSKATLTTHALVATAMAATSLLVAHAIRSPYPMPYWLQALPCYVGFACGMTWVYVIADEIVAITQALGLILSISEEILGLTIVGFGNSLGDLVTNVTLARAGYPTMAISACFGGPMLNFLLGIGIAACATLSNAGRSRDTYKIPITSPTVLVSTACLLFNSLLFLVVIPRQQYYMTRAVGLTAMAVYFVGMAVNVYIEW